MAPLRLVPPIHRATHRIGLYLAAHPSGGLTQGEAHILAHLAVSSPASLAELHRGLAHRRSTLTSILDRLTGRGLVTRDVGAADRRTFIVALTPKGKQVARQVHRRLRDLEAAVAAKATPAEMRACLKVLAAIEDEARRFDIARRL